MEEDGLRSLLIEWQEYCSAQSEIHDRMRAILRFRNYMLYLPAILLSTIAGGGNIGIGAQSCGSNSWLPIMFGSFGLASAAIITVHKYLNLAPLQELHDIYSDEFEKIAKDIRMQTVLGTGSETYRNLSEFAKDCKKRLDPIIDKAPPTFKSVQLSVENLRKCANTPSVRVETRE